MGSPAVIRLSRKHSEPDEMAKEASVQRKWYVGRKGLSWVTETTGFDGGTDSGTDCQEWRWLSPMPKRDGGSTEEDRSKVTDLDCDEMRHYIRQDRRWEGAPLSFHARSDQSVLLWDSSYHKESYSFSRSQEEKKNTERSLLFRQPQPSNTTDALPDGTLQSAGH